MHFQVKAENADGLHASENYFLKIILYQVQNLKNK